MIVLHATWSSQGVFLWGESSKQFLKLEKDSSSSKHPFVASENILKSLGEKFDDLRILPMGLPTVKNQPVPSSSLQRSLGQSEILDSCSIKYWDTLAVRWNVDEWLRCSIVGVPSEWKIDASVKWFMTVGRFVRELIIRQRFVPTIEESHSSGLSARWRLWLMDSEVRAACSALLNAMPPSVRAVKSEHEHNGWHILQEVFGQVADHFVRKVLLEDSFIESIDGRDREDPHVLWLQGLLGGDPSLRESDRISHELFSGARRWLSRLVDVAEGSSYRLTLVLEEPFYSEEKGYLNKDCWRLNFFLQEEDGAERMVPAETIYRRAIEGGPESEKMQQFLLSELVRASVICPFLEKILEEGTPEGVDLKTREANYFLSEQEPLLRESGVHVVPPAWWKNSQNQLAARLYIEAPSLESLGINSGKAGLSDPSLLGLGSVVPYQWQVVIGEDVLNEQELIELSEQKEGLVLFKGRWVQVDQKKLTKAREFLSAQKESSSTLLEAIRMTYEQNSEELGLPIAGMVASGWVEDLFGSTGGGQSSFERFSQPEGFKGTLRPYQEIGMSWLSFLDRVGLGGCLADDMGLGKTIQLIALLQLERAESAKEVGPTLLVAPTSVIGNWRNEILRFAPELNVHVHHGPDRPIGDSFEVIVENSDVIITTYGLVVRDLEMLEKVEWDRLALDEAQYIKNPPTKQARAIRSLKARKRVALTGTPVENRLTELWSIMEFLNPGYFGTVTMFRNRFVRPIEQHRDVEMTGHLRSLVRPFILRRLKTDSTVINDLPESVETPEYATLTDEQAKLYQQVVDTMLGQVDEVEQAQRRGIVLGALVKLKQICNHPAQFLKEERGHDFQMLEVDPLRSGKVQRLLSLLDEVMAINERSLIFTQFRQMGHLLVGILGRAFDRPVLYLHGGTAPSKRESLVQEFQSKTGRSPIFVLSLRAGGVGLNLTAANHVFHFDRWWNPAVENQATDRAYRIGQVKTVHVHKFICVGTLEERIDEMIKQKVSLAENVIGAGEDWLGDLTTDDLREMFALRQAAMEVEV